MADHEHLERLKQGVEVWNSWREQNFTESIDLYDVDFHGANLRGVNLSGANLSGAKLNGADLREADLYQVNLVVVNLNYANLSGANLREANLVGSYFIEVDCREANLRGASLREGKLCRAKLIEASLKEADLSKADLRGADLRRADLRGADLYEADLRGADLRGADLCEADLREADLREADLREVNFKSASLRQIQAIGANFSLSDFTDACIMDWHINDTTLFEGIKCESIYRGQDGMSVFINRLPINTEQNFKSGEFEEWIKISTVAQKTIDLTFTDGINWQAFFESLQGVRQDHPDAEVGIQAIEKKGNAFVIRLETAPEADLVAISSLQQELYDTKLLLAESKSKLEVFEGPLLDLTKILAERPIDKPPPAKKNTFMTFLAWFQNGQALVAIAGLIGIIIGVSSTYLIPKYFPNGFPPIMSEPKLETNQELPSPTPSKSDK